MPAVHIATDGATGSLHAIGHIGGHLLHQPDHEFECPSAYRDNIVATEAEAVLKALEVFASVIRGKILFLYCDNQSVIGAARRGGSNSSILNGLLRTMHDTLVRLGATIGKWTYVPTTHNLTADALSRHLTVREKDWCIRPSVLRSICHDWGLPPFQYDLFAAPDSFHAPRFATWTRDAFTLDWERLGFAIAIPPIILVSRTVEVVLSRPFWGLLIIPENEKQWYWDPLQRFVLRSRRLSDHLFFSPTKGLCPPYLASISMIALLVRSHAPPAWPSLE